MRRMILFNMLTIDGLFEGPNQDIRWHNVDEEFNEFAIQQLNSVDILVFGRVTYQLMAGYWPSPQAMQTDPVVARLMNARPKMVFSRTLPEASWSNTRLIKEIVPAEITKLKEQPGQDLIIFGSAALAAGMTKLGLIDEYRIMLNPVLLGAGVPLFPVGSDRLDLKFVEARVFHSGNVLLVYQPRKN